MARYAGRFACRVLAAELADEWVLYCRTRVLRGPDRPARAVRSFVAFADAWLAERGIGPQPVRLAGGPADLTEIIYEWEHDLRRVHPSPSKRGYELASSLLALLEQRSVREGDLPPKLAARAQAPPLFRKPAEPPPLEEFSQAERLALRDAARRDIRAVERRLAAGRALLETGCDPRQGGWERVANLVWAVHQGLLKTTVLRAHLPTSPGRWPIEIRQVAGDAGPSWAPQALLAGLAAMVFPRELDLQPFRVLLLLAMDECTPEELLDLALDDVEFTDGGVRLAQTKHRAGRIRRRLHTGPVADTGEGAAFEGEGRWDVPGLLRRLFAITDPVRHAYPDVVGWLWVTVEPSGAGRARVRGRRAEFVLEGRRLTDWITRQCRPDGRALEITAPHDARRLRKTAKIARVVALGGTIADLAGDDHHVEVFRRHYAHGTTAHVLAGRAVTTAQQKVFASLTRPVFADEEAVAELTEPEVSAALGLDEDTAGAMRDGQLDMGLVNCRDPYASPHTPAGSVCHVAPAMCMLCRNAVVFPSHLPRLVLLAEHIDQMRSRLTPPQWQALWGRQAAALAQLFEECAAAMPDARRAAQEGRARLHFPLGMRTEYDR
ncbi:hypothetical protein A6P39_002265 [Streptomyces sp. FXJ1.172]|uniref:hypothetical protein n=1 Tax=Streptomyces sp. FXJ1.172 TaxID=710705 RepID=UPI0007CF2953|nr:hypothetical protein [Streptomyces sp. FXJ1.172]WEO93004.1 hypothetical protein A6P39_002265 [Streptomyces sp. FXJ1.172]